MKIYDFNGSKNICGERIKEARKRLQLSQEMLAAKLQVEGVNIGRDASMCQIVLPLDSPKVSRSHCNLRYSYEDRTFILTDLASANGTYLLNGVQLNPKAPTGLACGTKFYLGDESTSFRVGIED